MEARIKALEVSQHYDVQTQAQLLDRLDSLHEMISQERSERLADKALLEATKSKLLLYLLGVMASALASLGILVLKIKAPGVFQ